MNLVEIEDRLTLISTDIELTKETFATDVKNGLCADPKFLSCIYFYDEKGSLLFEKICDLPEYYLTRTESEILRKNSFKIAEYLPQQINIVELGSGSSNKTRILIEKLMQENSKLTYTPIDISKEILEDSSMDLIETYSDIDVISIVAEYNDGLEKIKKYDQKTKLILWLGSSIGNMERQESFEFIRNMRKKLSQEDYILIGMDLIKDKSILEAAYNDQQGITAQFNLNILHRINRELGGDFDPSAFKHRAIYNENKCRIEMYIMSQTDQHVYIDCIESGFSFKRGEKIHTENSHKYSKSDILELADQTGLSLVDQWFDSQQRFSLNLFKVKSN